MLDWIKLGIGAVAGALVAGTVAYEIGHWRGEAVGRAAERAAALERSMELIRERSETNEEIGRMDDTELCRELGGRWMPDKARCE